MREELDQKAEEQSLLFERIPLVEDMQGACLLLPFCAATSLVAHCSRKVSLKYATGA